MSKFKIGDIVKDFRDITSNNYKYGLVKKINGIQIWCLWATSLINLNRKIYSSKDVLWADEKYLNKVGEEEKNVRVFGIVFFCLNKK